jgi:hypothetical protein
MYNTLYCYQQDFFLDLIFAPVERPAMGEAASSNNSSSVSPKATTTKSTVTAGSETASSETAGAVTATGARHRRQLSSQEVDSALGPVASSSGEAATAQQQQQREAGTAACCSIHKLLHYLASATHACSLLALQSFVNI